VSAIVSKSANEFVPKTRWVASLSNGETIFEDYRSDEEPAWKRLALYVDENGISITGMRAQFESGLEIKLPSGQEGYVQKKKAWCTGQSSGVMLCVGYIQGDKSLIHEASSSGDSVSKIVDDPGEPWTIYRKDIREARYATSKS